MNSTKKSLGLGVIVLVGILLVIAILSRSTESENATTTVQQLQPAEFASLLAEKDSVVIDVHTPEQEHITDEELFISEQDIATSSLLPTDKDTPIAVYCRSGSMSGRASQELVDMGYTNVSNLVGGKNAWDLYYQ